MRKAIMAAASAAQLPHKRKVNWRWHMPVIVAVALLLVAVYFSSDPARRRPGGGKQWPTPPSVTWHRFAASFNLPFDIALPPPEGDSNARVIMKNVYEDSLGDVFRVMLEGRCDPTDPAATVQVLDIGANLGIFAATSAGYGCKVMAVEAQSRLMPYMALTAARNGWEGRMQLRNLGVYDRQGELKFAYHSPAKGSQIKWMAMTMDAASVAECPRTPGCDLDVVPVVPTAELLTGDTLLVKIDVDGPEAVITKALLPALTKHKVESVLVEVCPPGWKSMMARDEGIAIFKSLVTGPYGYDLVVLDQINFEAYKPGFLERCRLIEGVFRPRAYVVPESMVEELWDDGTTAINCKNVVFTHVDKLMARYAAAGKGGVLRPVGVGRGGYAYNATYNAHGHVPVPPA